VARLGLNVTVVDSIPKQSLVPVILSKDVQYAVAGIAVATDRRESIESAGWQILRTFNTKGRRGLEGAYQQAILRVMMNDAAAIGARCIVRVGAHEHPARTARNRRHADRGGGQGNQPFRRGQLRGSRRSLSIKCEENVASH